MPELEAFWSKIVGAQISAKNPRRLKTEIDRLYANKAAHQQTGTNRQHHRTGDLGDDERRKGTPLRLTGLRPPTVKAGNNIETAEHAGRQSGEHHTGEAYQRDTGEQCQQIQVQ